MRNLKIGDRRKVFCNTCGLETNHELAAQLSRRNDIIMDEGTPNEFLGWSEEWLYRLWTCMGCETATYEQAFTDMGMEDPDGSEAWDRSFYPKRSTGQWQAKQFVQLDEKLSRAYREVVDCYNSSLPIACAMTLRAFLEGLCVKFGITDKEQWGLEGKLKELKRRLEKERKLPPHILDGLLSLKIIGDDAAHRLETLMVWDLRPALQVLEDLLNFLFQTDYERFDRNLREFARKRGAQIKFHIEEEAIAKHLGLPQSTSADTKA